jgi:CRP-like cAMP-binding protein
MPTALQTVSDPRQNQLLASLSDADWKRWQPYLEWVDLPLGKVLCRSGSTPGYVVFPTTAIVSLMYLAEDGASSEVAVVGLDGVVGLSLFMGGEVSPHEAVVQSAGQGYRLSAQRVNAEAESGGPVMRMLLRYTQALMTQVTQTAAYIRHHSIDQQFCRRLLQGLDRLPGNKMAMTQELAANLLGVRREGVTAAARKLQQAGVISYRRGHIEVLSRPRLEQGACEFYGSSKLRPRELLTMAA